MISLRTLVSFLLLCWGLSSTASAQSDRDALIRYLDKHQLYDLYADLLESDLSNAMIKDDKSETAKQLAAIYAERLSSRTEDYATYNQKLNQLLAQYSGTIPYSVQASIAFGRFRNAKGWFEEWIWKRGNGELNKQVIRQFDGVIARSKEAIAEIESKLAKLAESPGEETQLDAAAAQFQYLIAWSQYYKSMATNDVVDRQRILVTAKQYFESLLGVEKTKSLTEYPAQWWALESEWTCRLLLGLGMVCQALQQPEQAEYCFSLLSQGEVPLEIRTHQRVWKFHSFVFPSQLNAANRMVQTWENNMNARSDLAFWSSVAIAGASVLPSTPVSDNLIRAGLTGLARANEFQIIDEIHIQFPQIEIESSGFFDGWMDGYAALVRAQNGTQNSIDVQARAISRAVKRLGAALQLEPSVSPALRARCRYHYAFAHYLSQEYEIAAAEFLEASTILAPFDRTMASHASWMRCQSLERLAATNAAWSNSFLIALESFQENFPNAPQTAQATFLQLTHRLNQEPSKEILQALRRVEPNDPNYDRALFEICRTEYRFWESAENQTDKLERASATIIAADHFLQATASPNVGTDFAPQSTRVCLLCADVLMSQDLEASFAWLERAEKWLPAIAFNKNIQSDYHFLRQNLSAQRSQLTDEITSTKWLLENTENPTHRRSALIANARQLDRVLQQSVKSNVADLTEKRDLAIEAYQALLAMLGTDAAQLTRETASQTALFRLACLQRDAGQWAAAAIGFQQLHQVFPDQLPYLEGLAMVEMKQENWSDAAEHWRTIISAFPTGSENWLKGKYNLILCLTPTKPDRAKAVLEQVQLLVPELPGEWKSRYQALSFPKPELP